ncbi:MAG TPA: pyridoxamine 5'-phosphate oxidase family protein [Gallionella sp.]|nr:pyridoxamine 5'-phosphate oxidase family protein [Gallionella sp.]
MIAREARQTLRAHRYGALGTLSKKLDGYPFGSITPYLVDHDGSLLILISILAEHTKNILHDPRVSVITHDQRDPHILSQGRVTVIGNAEPEQKRKTAGLRYLRYFPEAQTYLAMHDFAFFRIRPVAIRYIGGFGKIRWVDIKKYAVACAEQFARQEESLLAELNAKSKTTVRKLLQQRYGIEAADMRAIGLDCDGLDIRSGEQVWRLDYPEAATEPSLDALRLMSG